MFRIQRSASGPALFWAMAALLVAIIAATPATIWLTLEVRKEQRAIAEIMRTGSDRVLRSIGTLPGELRWQFVLAIGLLFVLISSAIALAFMLRAYFLARRSLHEVQMLSADILASMDQGVITTNREGIITSANPSAESLLDIRFDCFGQPIETVCEVGTPLGDMSRDVLRQEKPIGDHDFCLHRAGHERRLRAACHLLKDMNDRVMGTVLHVRDVTERVLMEERMQRMERYMGLGPLAAGLHHEIKNPLSALSLHVQLLEESMSAGRTEDSIDHLDVLKDEVSRITGVLEGFRDYASVDRLSLEPVDLGALVDQAARLVRPQADRMRAIISTSCESELPPALVDAGRIEQVVLNLVLNGLEAMPDGGALNLRVFRSSADELTVEVEDSGPGIPESIQPRIFDPYFSTKSKGSGMGLALCEKIVQQHDGRITFECGHQGTRFQVTLPACRYGKSELCQAKYQPSQVAS